MCMVLVLKTTPLGLDAAALELEVEAAALLLLLLEVGAALLLDEVWRFCGALLVDEADEDDELALGEAAAGALLVRDAGAADVE